MELYKKYRPKLFKHVVGQPDAVRVLEDMLRRREVAHTILFTGPSGCGKTTLARIMKEKLECGAMDFNEVNCADSRGIDMVRDIQRRMGLAPVGGKCRIWLLDEVQALTKDAQSALLKILEDTPSHVYFMLCTTDPHKLLATIKTRSTEVRVKPLPHVDISMLITYVLGKENIAITMDVVERINDVAEGSARKALVLLHSVIGLKTEEEQLEAVLSSDAKKQAVDIARALLDNRTKFVDMIPLIKAVEEEPETIRRIVLGYATTLALANRNRARAILIINSFRDHWYDCGKSGLVAAIDEVLGGK